MGCKKNGNKGDVMLAYCQRNDKCIIAIFIVCSESKQDTQLVRHMVQFYGRTAHLVIQV